MLGVVVWCSALRKLKQETGSFLEAGERTPSVKHLPCKKEGQSVDPQNLCESEAPQHASMTPALGRQRRWIPKAYWSTSLPESANGKFSKRFGLKTEVEEDECQPMASPHDASAHTHSHRNMHIHEHTHAHRVDPLG